MWILSNIAGDPKTVIDLGCGEGKIMEIISKEGWDITGIDIHNESIKKAKTTGIYKKLIKGNIVTVCKQLVKEKKQYDLVFCSQVIEHITRKDGLQILNLAEKLAKKRIFFGTPSGFMHQPEVFIKGNPHQHHKSGWSDKDFKSRGYKVYGIGFKPLWSEHGMARTSNKVFEFFLTFVGFLLNPLIFYRTNLAAGILAIKDIKYEKV